LIKIILYVNGKPKEYIKKNASGENNTDGSGFVVIFANN